METTCLATHGAWVQRPGYKTNQNKSCRAYQRVYKSTKTKASRGHPNSCYAAAGWEMETVFWMTLLMLLYQALLHEDCFLTQVLKDGVQVRTHL